MKKMIAGIDIGGTKCAVSLAYHENHYIDILERIVIPTPETPKQAIDVFLTTISSLQEKYGGQHGIAAVGISCGGPLDSKKGLILSPPNLRKWDRIDVITPIKEKFHTRVALENDANACALAEWKWGAGKGAKNIIFLTFGTGMGAGLILNGQLYRGANDLAGEVGHIRIEEDGPEGHGKEGSFEGFCSGGGIARLAQRSKSEFPLSFSEKYGEINAKNIGLAAQAGEPSALMIYKTVGEKLGKGLAVLVDVLNPEKIIIGSIYCRQQEILEPIVQEVLSREALSDSLEACEIMPSGLGESVGDYASLSVAMNACNN